ncbi:glycine zipper 2TM domain-containing protein [Orrella sp. JC864]|uniref:glycine zipper 2TM domain-containing protein n=1 Tax=Orrella sp. JC864 TaxID=3120298 RepID=UPI0012BC5CE2
MNVRTASKAIAIGVLAVAASGCSSWDSMSSRQKSTVTGAGLGGVAGAVITNGGVLGTVGGAAIGGVIGDQIGKNR